LNFEQDLANASEARDIASLVASRKLLMSPMDARQRREFLQFLVARKNSHVIGETVAIPICLIVHLLGTQVPLCALADKRLA